MFYQRTQLSWLHLGTFELTAKPGRKRQTSGNSKIEKVQRREEFFQAPAVAARQGPMPGRSWWQRGQSPGSGLSLQEFKSGHQLSSALCPCPGDVPIPCLSILTYKTGLWFPHTSVAMIK